MIAPKMEAKAIFEYAYLVELNEKGNIALAPILGAIINDLNNEIEPQIIAAKFHNTLVAFIKRIADQLGIKHIAFSGGVFQNALLVDLIIHRMNRNYQLFWHQELSPNDENISFGQLVHELIEQKRLKNETYVFSNTWKN